MILPKSFFDTTPYFGLSISQSSIKIVSVSKTGQILTYANQPIGESSGQSSETEQNQLIQAFNQLKSRQNFTTPYVSVVLPESYAFTKEFSLPGISKEELGEAISWQISDIFPFAANEVYFDWKILTNTKQASTALVVATPKKRIDDIRTALAKVGLFPISFEPTVSALSRISNLKEEKLGILVDINTHHNSMSLIENGISLLTTTNIIADANQDLISNIQFTLKELVDFYQEKKSKNPDNLELVLTGDLAEPNLTSTLKAKTSLPVSLLQIDKISPGFHAAYAAASSQIQPPEDQSSINLLPQDLQEWYASHYHQYLQKRAVKIQTATFIAGLCLTALNLTYLTLTQNSQTPLQPAPSPTTQVNQTQIIQKANRITTLFPQKVGPQEDLQTILMTVPPTINIESVSYEAGKKTYQLVGIAQSRDDLINLKSDLEATKLFSKVNLPIAALTQSENLNFTLELIGVGAPPTAKKP